jgi:N-acetylmuramoyl-L-alanine amidase
VSTKEPIQRPSPNFDNRDQSHGLRFIVIHYTGMISADAALARLCDPKAKVSAHYLIDEAGRTYALVEESKRAWHAGVGTWRGITDINSASVGIELANPGHQHGYRAFPQRQLNAVQDLILGVMQRHNIPASGVIGHADVAPDRKEDPGELFPWEALAVNGAGIWPEVKDTDYKFATDDEVQKLLRGVGYDCPLSGTYDKPTRMALIAFQRHFHPENLTGTPENETIARLRALTRLLQSSGGAYRPA